MKLTAALLDDLQGDHSVYFFLHLWHRGHPAHCVRNGYSENGN